jgi:putative glutamine amidotransferase
MSQRPVIGVTADIEFRPDGRPPRDCHFLDATNSRMLSELGAVPILLPCEIDAVDDYVALCDGILVSGGGYQFPVPGLLRDDGSEPPEKVRRLTFEMALLQRLVERDRATLGVCGGFQVLNRVTGGELVPRLADAQPAWAQHRGEHYQRTVHAVQPVAGTRFESLVGSAAFDVNSMHRQGVVACGPGAVVAGVAPDGIVEAIEVPGRRFCIGVQWHPEFLLCEPERRLLAAFVDACRG